MRRALFALLLTGAGCCPLGYHVNMQGDCVANGGGGGGGDGGKNLAVLPRSPALATVVRRSMLPPALCPRAARL